MGYNIDNEIAFKLLSDFARTKVPSIELCLIVKKLIHNKLQNRKYASIDYKDKEDMASEAMLDFLKYGHNFKPKKGNSKGIAIGYLNFNMNNTFNRIIKKLSNISSIEEGLYVDIAYWDYDITNLEKDEDEY